MQKLHWILSLFPFLLLTQPAALAAAPEDISLAAEAAFGGRFKYGEWLPVFVVVENSGPDFTGELRVSMANQTGQLNFAVPAELPGGARKRFTIYTLPNNFSRKAQVELVQGEETLRKTEVNLSLLPNDRYIIGVVAAEAEGMTAVAPPQLPGRREVAQLVSFSPEQIPDRAAGLRIFNALMLNGIDTSTLTPDQRTALTEWVRGGGRLIIGGGTGAGRTLAGLPPELQPVRLAATQEVEALPGLETYAGEPIRVPGPFLVAGIEPVEGTTTLVTTLPAGSSDNLPLVVEQPLGTGYIDFIALDLSHSPFDAWAGLTDFVKKLLAPGAAWPSNLPPDVSAGQMSDGQMAYALTNLPSLDLPSIRLLSLLLAGYIILVGPANYFFLRWRDRLAWAWVTIPAITLAFSVIAYGIGFGLRGSDIIVNQISVVKLGPGGDIAEGRTYVGVFSPGRRSYDVEVAADTLVRPLNTGGYYDPWSSTIPEAGAMSVIQTEPARVRGLTVDQWSMQSFVVEAAPMTAPGLVADLAAERNGVRGRLANEGILTWRDVVIVFNGQFQKLGDLAPGQTAEIELDLTKNAGAAMSFGSYMLFQEEFNRRPTGPSREVNFKQTVLDGTVFNISYNTGGRGPLLIGWLAESSLPVRLEGQEIATQESTLLYGTLPLRFDQTEEVVVPPGFGRPEMLAMEGNSGPCNWGIGLDGYHVYQGSVETKLTLPQEFHGVQPDQLDLYIRTDGGWQTLPPIEIYDQTGQAWVQLEDAKAGANPIEDIGRFYNPEDASVQLRVSSDGQMMGGGCLFFDLALEGKRV